MIGPHEIAEMAAELESLREFKRVVSENFAALKQRAPFVMTLCRRCNKRESQGDTATHECKEMTSTSPP